MFLSSSVKKRYKYLRISQMEWSVFFTTLNTAQNFLEIEVSIEIYTSLSIVVVVWNEYQKIHAITPIEFTFTMTEAKFVESVRLCTYSGGDTFGA